MIPSVKFTKAFRCFSEGSTIDFCDGVNLIVGDQGCGKSTLIQSLAAAVFFQLKPKESQDPKTGLTNRGPNFDPKTGVSRDKVVVELAKWEGPPGKFAYFDFEQHNPRTQPAFDMGFGYDTVYQIQARFSSHGQAQLPILKIIEALGSGLVVFDEPDMAMSVRSITQFVKNLKEVTKDEGQVILSAHNPELIAAFPEVLSLEHGKWMPSSEFLELQRTTDAPEISKDPRVLKVVYYRDG